MAVGVLVVVRGSGDLDEAGAADASDRSGWLPDGEAIAESMVVRGFAMGLAVAWDSKVLDGSVGEWSKIERRLEL